MRNRWWMMVAIAWLGVGAGGCELANSLGGGEAQVPSMSYKETALLNNPSTQQIAAYFCPGSFGSTLCTPALGAAPAKDDLRFDFEVTLGVQNPNSLPIPTLSMLLATTLFEGAGAEELGAVCVTFCEPGDESCSGQGAAEDCRADDDDTIDSFDDFLGKTTENLVNIATGQGNAFEDNINIKTIPANGESDVKVVFTLGVDPMANILGQVADQYVSSFLNGAGSTLEIPYSLRGTLWMDLPFNYGRFGAGFGPFDELWSL